MTQMDDLGALRLQDAAHDVDRRVVAVKQGRGGDEPHGMLGPVQVTGHSRF